MRYRYWIDIILGAVLILSPYVGNFTQDHPASYTNIVVGLLLAIWGIVSYVVLDGAGAREPHPDHSS